MWRLISRFIYCSCLLLRVFGVLVSRPDKFERLRVGRGDRFFQDGIGLGNPATGEEEFDPEAML
jgi:hypothetical protein